MKFILVLLNFTILSAAINFDSPDKLNNNDYNLKKHNVILGAFDDRTGLSFLGYTYNVYQTEKDEFFIGGGTMIIGFTGTLGWKHYYRKSRFSISSAMTLQRVYHLGFIGTMPTSSFTLEYQLLKSIKIKFGAYGAFLITDDWDFEPAIIPFLNLNF